MPPKKRAREPDLCLKAFREARAHFVLTHVHFADYVYKNIDQQFALSIMAFCKNLYPFDKQPAPEPKNKKEQLEQIKLAGEINEGLKEIKAKLDSLEKLTIRKNIFKKAGFSKFEKITKDFLAQYLGQNTLLASQPNVAAYFQLLKSFSTENNALATALLFQELINQFNPRCEPSPLKRTRSTGNEQTQKENLTTLSKALPVLFKWQDEHDQKIENGTKEAIASSIEEMRAEINQVEKTERECLSIELF